MHPMNQHLLPHVAGGAALAAVTTPALAPVSISELLRSLHLPTPPRHGGPIHGPTYGLSTASQDD